MLIIYNKNEIDTFRRIINSTKTNPKKKNDFTRIDNSNKRVEESPGR